MDKTIMSVQKIKSVLLRYHIKKGYKIFESFPLVSNDPTVMFVNATITPFKHLFTNSSSKPLNYALFQKCFRMERSNEQNIVGTNPYYHTFFEMFGSGTFDIDHLDILKYLFELLDVIGLEKSKMYFTIPNDAKFKEGLLACGVEQSRIFVIKNNKIFWQEWKFGKGGPVGKGLTLIYSRSDENVVSIEQMHLDYDRFVELLNLIYVYGRETQDGTIVPAVSPGFDFGIGIERLSAVIQNCNNYQINSIRPLYEVIVNFFKEQGHKTEEKRIRILTDHLRAICLLVDGNVKSSNKTHGYVLRKLIRQWIELVWISLNEMVTIEILRIMIKRFCDQLCQSERKNISSVTIINVIEKEILAIQNIIQKATIVLQKQPNTPTDILWDTYGLSPKIATLIKKKETEI